jgi:hypothetical protein
LTVINSTVRDNLSGHDNNGYGTGGGILNRQSGTITLRNVTVARNSTFGGYGGGILNSPIGQVTLKNTLIGDNDATGGGPDCSGTLTSQGYNLIELPYGGCTIAGDTTGNITGANAGIGALQDNGGPTFTHALERSQAINAGDPASCTDAQGQLLTADQRGVARPQGLRCDIGAFEREAAQSYESFLPMVIR